ncbi:aminoglycoside 6'-N-acetyltransferase [Spirosoma pulveris]
MEIEPLSRYTLNAVVDLVLELWPDCDLNEELQNYARLLSSDNDACFVAKIEDSCVAFVHVSCRYDYVEGSVELPVAYMEGIYVKPAYRKQGIAQKLVRTVEDWAKHKGLTQLASDTELMNVASIDFHKKTGFEEVERIVCFIKDLP